MIRDNYHKNEISECGTEWTETIEIKTRRTSPQPFPKFIEASASLSRYIKHLLPHDTDFIVKEWRITLARDNKPLLHKRLHKPKATSEDLAKFKALATSGDKLFIEIIGVARTTFDGKVKNINVGTRYFNLFLN